MNSEHPKVIIRTLILIARPAAGKSEIIHFLSQMSEREREEKYLMGKLEMIDDFPFLWRWLEEDDLLKKMGKPSLYTNEDGIFQHTYLWDLLIKLIDLEYAKFKRDKYNLDEYTVLIEFSRGKEHGGYAHALPLLSDDILESAAILYVDVPWEESLRKNRERFNPDKPDSILEHSLPDDRLKHLYYECDFKEIAPNLSGFLNVRGFEIPYAIFNNQKDLTTHPGQEFFSELNRCLEKLRDLMIQA
jgi:hypothetical protein